MLRCQIDSLLPPSGLVPGRVGRVLLWLWAVTRGRLWDTDNASYFRMRLHSRSSRFWSWYSAQGEDDWKSCWFPSLHWTRHQKMSHGAQLISAVLSLEFCFRFSRCFYKWACFINGSDSCHRCCPAVWEKPWHDWSKLCGVHFCFQLSYSHFSYI